MLLFVSASFFPHISYLHVYGFFKKFLNVFTCSMQINGKNILQGSKSVVAMTHDSHCCEDFVQFRRSQVVKTLFVSVSP